MRRITIRNMRSQRTAKPRVFDALIDGNRVFFEVKVGRGTEIIALNEILEQIASAESQDSGPSQEEEHLKPGA